MAEELENSLLKTVEAFLNERLRMIEEQINQLQDDFNERLTGLRAASATASIEETALAGAIASHLQTAREQKLSGPSTNVAPPPDLSALKKGIRNIQEQSTQGDVLTALLRGASRFADRVFLFVVKGEQAIAWRKCHANRNEVEPVTGVAVRSIDENIVSHAIHSRATERANLAEGGDFVSQLIDDAQQAVAVPLVIRNKVVAVLYADSAWPHPDAIQLDGLEVLERVAAMRVELVSHPRTTQTASPSVSPTTVEPVHEVERTESAEALQPPELARAEEAEAEPEMPAAETVAVEPEAAAPAPEPSEAEEEAAPQEAAPEKSAEPEAFPEQYSAPLGNARRFGGADADLPADVSDEERRLHNDARRFARLLVSEIKLYNEAKVSEGRNQSDLYDRLREDIERSRQMYDKRVAPPVAARYDYFHQELVNLLAEGDAAKLGSSYPGAAVAV